MKRITLLIVVLAALAGGFYWIHTKYNGNVAAAWSDVRSSASALLGRTEQAGGAAGAPARGGAPEGQAQRGGGRGGAGGGGRAGAPRTRGGQGGRARGRGQEPGRVEEQRGDQNVERPRTDDQGVSAEGREQPVIEPQVQETPAPVADAPDTTTQKQMHDDPTKLEGSGNEAAEKSGGEGSGSPPSRKGRS